MRKHSIGIMQGRLTPQKGRGIQFFPFDNWQREFHIAKEIGLQEIEFIFDYDRYDENPLWTSQGIEEMLMVTEQTGVSIRAVCFDYFMRRPFYKSQEDQNIVRAENMKITLQVAEAMKKLQIPLLEIPLVDASSLKSTDEKEKCRVFLTELSENLPEKILLGLETDFPPKEFLEFLTLMDSKKIGANYDSGNSSGLGYEPYEEILALKDRIFNIHIKDRVFQGTTVELGAGSADFDRLFAGLKEISYQGGFILQAARGEEGKEKNTIKRQMGFVESYLNKYQV